MFGRLVCVFVVGIVASVGLLEPCAAADVSYDTIIHNGHVIDGTGSPWYAANIAIKDGRIAAIGRLDGVHAKHTIDAHGLVVAPGFIDMLGQSELSILVDPHVPSKIYQGITTEITGEGNSVAPLDAVIIKQNQPQYDHLHITPDWRTFPQYFARLRKQGIGINVGDYVGAASVRAMVLGYKDSTPTPDQLKDMQKLVADAMQAGAMGLSSALQSTPGAYAKSDELIALAKIAGRYGGVYATHIRSEGGEGDGEMVALDEAFQVGRKADIPLEIFHLKAAGKASWGTMPRVIARIDAARASGVDVAADTYAYTAWHNNLSSFIPPWTHEGGTAKLIQRLKGPTTRARVRKDIESNTDWNNVWLELGGDPSNVQIASVANKALQKYVGKRVSEIAAEWHEDPIDTIIDFLIEDDAATGAVVYGMQESDVERALKQPWVSVNTDGPGTAPTGLLSKDQPHPRSYGTFPRILAKYVRDQKLLTLPDAIRKFSALPAQRMHLTGRGVLKQGMWADIVVFNPATIHDVATYTNPNQLSVGMQYVLVNGVPVIDHGKMTNALPGRVLLGPGYADK